MPPMVMSSMAMMTDGALEDDDASQRAAEDALLSAKQVGRSGR